MEEKGKEINNLKSCNTLNESSPTKETKYSATNATNNSLSNIVNSVSNDKIFGLGITKMNGTRHIQAQNKFLETRCLNAEKARDAIATKLVSMGTELTKMQGLASELETMKQKHNNLEKKQNVLLEILGEKTEEVNELNSDIQEMKRMYRQQTETLLEQLAAKSTN